MDDNEAHIHNFDTHMSDPDHCLLCCDKRETALRIELATAQARIKSYEEQEVRYLDVTRRLEERADDLYAEVNAYMCPTEKRMSSREGLRQALSRYRASLSPASPDGVEDKP